MGAGAGAGVTGQPVLQLPKIVLGIVTQEDKQKNNINSFFNYHILFGLVSICVLLIYAHDHLISCNCSCKFDTSFA
jgi:hypothetical protein